MSSTDKAIRQAVQAGFDLSLLEVSLALTLEERVRQHDAALELVTALRSAGRQLHAKPRTPPAKAR